MNRCESIIFRALAHYGKDAQLLMLIEELDELADAVRFGDFDKISEEVADVAICLKYAFLIYGIPDDSLQCNPDEDMLLDVSRRVRLFICRLQRGRSESPDCIWKLAGWLLAWSKKNNAIDDIKSITKSKLLRLEGRMDNE